jgi:hypothetical protein
MGAGLLAIDAQGREFDFLYGQGCRVGLGTLEERQHNEQSGQYSSSL